MLQVVLSTLGAFMVVLAALEGFKLVQLYTRKSDLEKYRKKHAWALVTGSSDGLGLGLADQLLCRGFNVVLHGRSETKLGSKREALQKKYPSRAVAVVAADASRSDSADIERITKLCQDLPGPLTVLVNNVGGQPTSPRHWTLDSPPQDGIKDMMNANALFPTLLTSALLPLLKKNGPCLIVNSGSAGALVPSPYLVVYSGTKAYIHTFSTSLAAEVAEHDVDVLGATFGAILTPGNPHPGQDFMVTPEEAARACLDKVGCGQTVVLAHWKFWIQMFFFDVLPKSITSSMGMKIMKRRVQEEKEMLEKAK